MFCNIQTYENEKGLALACDRPLTFSIIHYFSKSIFLYLFWTILNFLIKPGTCFVPFITY